VEITAAKRSRAPTSSGALLMQMSATSTATAPVNEQAASVETELKNTGNGQDMADVTLVPEMSPLTISRGLHPLPQSPNEQPNPSSYVSFVSVRGVKTSIVIITSVTDFAFFGNRGKDSNITLQQGQCQR
jgi:hypothetical protein